MSKPQVTSYRSTIRACYLGAFTQAAVINVTPIIFIPLREQFGLAYSQLGLLVLINFFTQLLCDLLFSNAADKYGFRRFAVAAPALAFAGFVLFALAPVLFPAAPYTGFVIATVVFSGAGGLLEVLLSPIVNAIPTDEKTKAMSFLHASYSWGFVVVVLLTSLFLTVFSRAAWPYIVLFWAVLPLVDALMFLRVPLAPGVPEEHRQGMKDLIGNPFFIAFFLIIAAGGAAENSVSQWASSFIEKGLQLPKLLGDAVGVCGFALMMGLGRAAYGSFGSRWELSKFMLTGNVAVAVCLLTAAFSPFPWLTLAAFAICGFAVSQLWPGTLLLAAERFPLAGAWMFAILAAAGDIGSSFGPWFLGIAADWIPAIPCFTRLSQTFGITAEQLGLRAAMLTAVLFPLLGILTLVWFRRKNANDRKGE